MNQQLDRNVIDFGIQYRETCSVHSEAKSATRRLPSHAPRKQVIARNSVTSKAKKNRDGLDFDGESSVSVLSDPEMNALQSPVCET